MHYTPRSSLVPLSLAAVLLPSFLPDLTIYNPSVNHLCRAFTAAGRWELKAGTVPMALSQLHFGSISYFFAEVDEKSSAANNGNGVAIDVPLPTSSKHV